MSAEGAAPGEASGANPSPGRNEEARGFAVVFFLLLVIFRRERFPGFEEIFYRTGDLVRADENGDLQGSGI